MTHVVTGACCKDATCVAVCPVDCIQPAPGTPGFADAEMLFIDPATCIDCGSCVDECPVGAIRADHALTPDTEPYLMVNAAQFTRPHRAPVPSRHVPSDSSDPEQASLRVAIVGSGPSGAYAASALLGCLGTGARLDVYDRLATPWGLIRHGVAPDHLATKQISEQFAVLARDSRLRFLFGVEVGVDVAVVELTSLYDAVVFAHGAPEGRSLGIPGEDLPGSHHSARVVSWYNGHPDASGVDVDVDVERAVVVGNGNVAIDVARLLLMSRDDLVRSDVAPAAFEALSGPRVREVHVLGRRGPLDAACTTSELIGLDHLPDTQVVIDPDDLLLDEAAQARARNDPQLAKRLELFERWARSPRPGRRRLVMSFGATPLAVLGRRRMEAVEIRRSRPPGHPRATSEPTLVEQLPAGLLVTAVGHRSVEVPGLPFDQDTGTVPNRSTRVLGQDGHTLRGVYVVGWARRGASGVIGTNRTDAEQLARDILEDEPSLRSTAAHGSAVAVEALLAERALSSHGWHDWRMQDEHERRLGAAQGRPRVKLSTRSDIAQLRPSMTDVRRGRER